jgi:nucleotide-binding universal stress UspA family protein
LTIGVLPRGGLAVSLIVVGVDGSQESKNALRWAVAEAGLRGAELRVIHAYDFQPTWRHFPYGEAMTREQVALVQESIQREAAEARQHAEGLLASAVDEVSDGSVKVQTVVLQDHHPAEALVNQSKDADMLVVGSRGRGGFTGLVLGSVSQQCLHHASCPVVVVRPRS